MESLLGPSSEDACARDSPLSAWRVQASTKENERFRVEEQRGGKRVSKLKRAARGLLQLPKEFAYLATFIVRVFA